MTLFLTLCLAAVVAPQAPRPPQALPVREDPAVIVPSCGCSTRSTCGCQEGEPCRCGEGRGVNTGSVAVALPTRVESSPAPAVTMPYPWPVYQAPAAPAPPRPAYQQPAPAVCVPPAYQAPRPVLYTAPSRPTFAAPRMMVGGRRGGGC